MELQRNASQNEKLERRESPETLGTLGKYASYEKREIPEKRRTMSRGERRLHRQYHEKEIENERGRGTVTEIETGNERGRWEKRGETSQRHSTTADIRCCSLPSTISDRAQSEYMLMFTYPLSHYIMVKVVSGIFPYAKIAYCCNLVRPRTCNFLRVKKCCHFTQFRSQFSMRLFLC